MFNAWFYLMLLVAPVDWYATYKGLEKVRLITKPAVLILLIAWFITAGGVQGAGWLFVVALVFSLLGDIFLLSELVRRRAFFFQLGLLSFLVTQILYTISFQRPLSFVNPVSPLFFAGVALVSYFNARPILPGLLAKPDGKGQAAPVVVYMAALSLMLASALSTLPRADWPPASALLLALGAGLFYLSDSLIAHTKFVREIRGGDLVLMIAYHLGQFAIAAAFLTKI